MAAFSSGSGVKECAAPIPAGTMSSIEQARISHRHTVERKINTLVKE
jgi:hypothetical protein